jgi:hypothetical protein
MRLNVPCDISLKETRNGSGENNADWYLAAAAAIVAVLASLQDKYDPVTRAIPRPPNNRYGFDLLGRLHQDLETEMNRFDPPSEEVQVLKLFRVSVDYAARTQ